MANRWLTPVVLGLLGGAVAIAQTPPPTPVPTPAPQQTPVFRSRTALVPLTVTVTDLKGVPITDLKQSDFTVYENKVQREIVSFFPQAFVPGPAGAAPVDGIGPETRRTFVFVLAGGLFQNVFTALDRTIKFIREDLEPNDAIALMAYDRTTPLTTDHELVARVLERYKNQNDRLINDLWKSTVVTTPALFGTRKENDPRVIAAQAKVWADIDALFEGLHPTRKSSDFLIRAMRDADRSGNPSLGAVMSGSNSLKLFAGIEFLRHVGGEKHLVFMSSGGLAPDDEEAAARVARRAADARVIVDMIGNYGFSWGSRRVAELTGGYYSTLDYTDKSLAKIDRKSRFSYLLGYTPLNSELDGKFRSVDVKVNRRGVVLRFSLGYYARTEPEPIDPVEWKELIVRSRVESALAYESMSVEIPLTATALVLPRMGIQAETRVELKIDASRLGWSTEEGIRKGQIELRVYCGDAKEAIIGDFSEHLDLQANEETHAQWLQTGVHRSIRVPINGVPKYVKVVVYDYGTDRVGSYMLTLKDKK